MTIQKRGILMTMTRKIVMMKIILVMRKMLKESNRCNVRWISWFTSHFTTYVDSDQEEDCQFENNSNDTVILDEEEEEKEEEEEEEEGVQEDEEYDEDEEESSLNTDMEMGSGQRNGSIVCYGIFILICAS